MRGLRIAAAIIGTFALFLWMANRDRVPHGPLFGMLIAVAAVWGWAGWITTPDTRPAETFDGARVLALVLGFVAVLYAPSMGQGLWDPWETHYAEVAREILARNDWISLWWAQDKWFWSKPVLLFWMEALSMGALGIDFAPDANPAFVEWAVRLPHLLIVLAAMAVVFLTVRRIFDTRAGALSVLVVATTPQVFLVTHQAITDVPLMALLTAAICMFVLAVREDPERIAEPVRVGRFTISPRRVVIGIVLALVLPQALYLLSRNVALDLGASSPLTFPQDAFLYGSAGNDAVPGNVTHSIQRPFVRNLGGQPAVQGAMWLAALAMALMVLRKEQRAQRLQMILFYVFCALAFLAKGLPGIALPGVVALLYLVVTRRWDALLEGRFAVGPGIAIVSLVSLPWYVAMYVRHGPSFTNRLLIHDHINRLASGVHGDTGSIQYFVEQLGFALFPWVGLLPLAAIVWRRGMVRQALGSANPEGRARDAILVLVLWFLASFALFSAMVTKFHHYILPAVVPAAMLVGIALSGVWGRGTLSSGLWIAVGSLCLVLGLGGIYGSLLGRVPSGAAGDNWVLAHGPSQLTIGVLLLLGVVCLLAAARSLRRDGESISVPIPLVGAAFAAGACIVALVGRDLSWATSARPQGYERLIHLFVYNYGRAWPEHIDYRPALTGFIVCGAVFVGAATFSRTRRLAVRGIAAVAVLFTIWSLNVYMPSLAPHWGQKELITRYYDRRASASEPLVGWQMNWKGENFYTGNHVSVFVDLDNKKFNQWLRENKGKSAYFIFEHSRMAAFKRVMGVRDFTPVSTKRDNNKFVLVHAKL